MNHEDEDEEENKISELFEFESSKPIKSLVKEVKQNRTRVKNYDYDFVFKYPNAEEALKAFASEKSCWSKGKKKETRDHTIISNFLWVLGWVWVSYPFFWV